MLGEDEKIETFLFKNLKQRPSRPPSLNKKKATSEGAAI